MGRRVAVEALMEVAEGGKDSYAVQSLQNLARNQSRDVRMVALKAMSQVSDTVAKRDQRDKANTAPATRNRSLRSSVMNPSSPGGASVASFTGRYYFENDESSPREGEVIPICRGEVQLGQPSRTKVCAHVVPVPQTFSKL